MKSVIFLEKFKAHELNICVRLNGICSNVLVREFFSVISWLGDGRIWYALMLLFPLVFGEAGVRASVDMAIVAILGHIVYKLIKENTRRPRPYVQSQSITMGDTPVDQYSFPSGHTLHAVAFTLVAIAHFPSFALLLVPLTVLIAISRMALGLHYPSDVVLGAAIGVILAKGVPYLLSII